VKKVGIIGAGLSGLNCARILEKSGLFEVHLFDKNQKSGGRVMSTVEKGFVLDHGFQVYLPGYKEGMDAFDYNLLNLRSFSPGAYIKSKNKLHYIGDPIREPSSLWSTITAPVGSLADKLKILALKSSIESKKKQTTLEYLKDFGFSDKMIESFFRPFFSGVFLERNLDTPSEFFCFIYQLFSMSKASLPAKGMGDLASNLEGQLKSTKKHFGSEITSFDSTSINGQPFDFVVKAFAEPQTKFYSVTTDYFTTPGGFKKPSLYLNNDDGIINHIAPLSRVAEEYSGSNNEVLISVNLIGDNVHAPVEKVEKELKEEWFPGHQFTHLKRFHIEKALPITPSYGQETLQTDGVFQCGDHLQSPSINGALASGRAVAEEILKS
jgi:hypothetical protein